MAAALRGKQHTAFVVYIASGPTLTAERDAVRCPSALVTNASRGSQQFKASFTGVGGDRAIAQRLVGEGDLAVGGRARKTARLTCKILIGTQSVQYLIIIL